MDPFGWFSIAVGVFYLGLFSYMSLLPDNRDEWYKAAKEKGWTIN